MRTEGRLHLLALLLIRDGFDLWTSNGRFVLYDGGRFWEVPREELVELIGPQRAAKLSTPLHYWVPPGMATVLILAGVICVCVYRSTGARAKRLVKNPAFHQALQVYTDSLPRETEATGEDRKKAFAAAVAFLQDSGIPPEKGAPSLRLLVGELERDHSYDFRNQAVAHEEAGKWEQAIALYEQAARLREEWDQRDYQFLLKCVKRVQDKQARSRGS